VRVVSSHLGDTLQVAPCCTSKLSRPFRPRHHKVHFVKELALARALGRQLETGCGKALLLHGDSTLDGLRSLTGYAEFS
jgi:hypothetical protein